MDALPNLTVHLIFMSRALFVLLLSVGSREVTEIGGQHLLQSLHLQPLRQQ
jgi:hypothetical protein